MTVASRLGRAFSRLVPFSRDARGASAVEFAIVSGPFLLVFVYVMQIGLYYMTQSALDTGVVRTADSLRNGFNTVGSTRPDAAALKTAIVSRAGAIIANDGTLAVEIRPLAGLAAGIVPITDGVADYGATTSVLVLHAQSSVVSIVPSFSVLTKVTATSVIRRQGR